MTPGPRGAAARGRGRPSYAASAHPTSSHRSISSSVLLITAVVADLTDFCFGHVPHVPHSASGTTLLLLLLLLLLLALLLLALTDLPLSLGRADYLLKGTITLLFGKADDDRSVGQWTTGGRAGERAGKMG
jgi:hypothetical protein